MCSHCLWTKISQTWHKFKNFKSESFANEFILIKCIFRKLNILESESFVNDFFQESLIQVFQNLDHSRMKSVWKFFEFETTGGE